MEWATPLCSEKVTDHFVKMYRTHGFPENLKRCPLTLADDHEYGAKYLLLWADAESLMALCRGCTMYALRALTSTGANTDHNISSLSLLGCHAISPQQAIGTTHVHVALIRNTPDVSMLWH